MKQDRPRTVILPHEAGYHLGTMPRQLLVVPAAVLSITVGCTSRTPSPPILPTPGTPAVPGPASTYLRFSAGTYRYRLAQTVEIKSDRPLDTVASTIQTGAIFLVRATSDNDSTFQVSVSIDSIRIATGGFIPPRSISQISALDSVLHITFTPTRTITQVLLPDSLCAYGQFISTARQILVPELPFWVESPSRERYSDSTTVRSCHAGTIVEGLTVRQVTNLGRSPPEFSIEQTTEFIGTGLLRRDSITVTGSTSTRGTLSFQQGNRLPLRMHTKSEGTVSVQLGISRTEFRQVWTQDIQLETATPN